MSDSQWRRGERDGWEGSPPSELSERYLEGFTAGRKLHLEANRWEAMYGWRPEKDTVQNLVGGVRKGEKNDG